MQGMGHIVSGSLFSESCRRWDAAGGPVRRHPGASGPNLKVGLDGVSPLQEKLLTDSVEWSCMHGKQSGTTENKFFASVVF